VDLADKFGFAARSILAHRLRSSLTMLGILIGIASVILLTSIGEGTRTYILDEFTQFGTHIISVRPGKSTTTGMPGAVGATIRKLTNEDASALSHIVGIEAVAPLTAGMARVEAGERGRSVFVVGVTDKVSEVFSLQVRQGRFVPPMDLRRAAPLAVLAPTLKRELFGERNALGERVRIAGQRFLVIGIMEPKGNILGLDVDDRVYVPLASAQRMFNQEGLLEIHLHFSSHLTADALVPRIKEVLRQRHEGEEDFTIVTQAEMLGVLDRVLGIVSMAVGAIGGISLVVGAIGILTMMWISVNERTGEIGLLRALGATPGQVLTVFLIEAALLSLAGGALGIATGFGIARSLWLVAPGLPLRTPVSFIIAALVVSGLVGLASGVLPARRASALDPVEALRAE
jgi:putative ABC transport system permease protein